MNFSISKWEAWWTFATFYAKQSCLFRAKKLVKKPPRFPFRDFPVPQVEHLFDTNLFTDLLCVEAFSRTFYDTIGAQLWYFEIIDDSKIDSYILGGGTPSVPVETFIYC